MRGLRSVRWEKPPDGWSDTVFFGRIVLAGLCRYAHLKDGTLSIDDVFGMHRMLDYREYARMRAAEKAERAHPRKERNSGH